jgi:hypothetical protein
VLQERLQSLGLPFGRSCVIFLCRMSEEFNKRIRYSTHKPAKHAAGSSILSARDRDFSAVVCDRLANQVSSSIRTNRIH